MVFAIQHEKFEGPLHFLLEEIEKEKLSVNEVSLARITNSFLEYIKALPESTQHEIAEFIVVASQLLLIKSRSLLPSIPLTEEEQYSIEELQERLRILQKIRECAEALGKINKNPGSLFAREAFLGVGVVFYPPPKLTPEVLSTVFSEILSTIPKPQEFKKEIIEKVISLEEKITELQQSLQNRAERLFSDIMKKSENRTEIIVNFLAILELAKQKIITLDQGSLFGDIVIRKKEEHGESSQEN